MPYNYTHALVGLLAVSGLEPPAQKFVRENRAAFLIGTMGPDPYFGDAFPPPLCSPCRETFAGFLHGLPAKTLLPALFSSCEGKHARIAYTMGFLCHFVTDAAAHPYIEARFSGKAHTPAEIALDLALIRSLPQADLILPMPPKRLYDKSLLPELDRLHASLFFALGRGKTQGAFARSARKWIRLNALTYDPRGRKLRFFSALETALRIENGASRFLVAPHEDLCDRMNLSHAPWSAPWAKAELRTESFPDLIEAAYARCVPVLKFAYAVLCEGSREAMRALYDALGEIGMEGFVPEVNG